VAEDSTFAVMLRLQVDGVNATQSVLSAITWKAWDEQNTGTVHASGTLTVSSVVFDTLQTDGRWTADSTGYNFRHDITQATFTDPGRYVIEYTVTMTGGNSFIAGPVAVNVQGRLTDGE
jgi:hypothetical protein